MPLRIDRAARLAAALAATLVVLGVIIVLWLARSGPAPDLEIPDVTAPTPVPALPRATLHAPLRIRLHDIDLTATDGTRIRASRADAVGSIGGEPTVRLQRLVVDQPVVTLPPGRAVPTRERESDPAAGVATLFGDLDLPWTRIDTLRIRDGRLRRRGSVGRAATDLREIEVLLTDVALGRGADRLAFAVSGRGSYEGRPVLVRSVAGTVRRAPSRLDIRAAGRLDRTRGRISATIRPDGVVDVRVDADTVLFTELAGWADLPESGGGRIRATIRNRPGALTLDIDRLSARTGDSHVEAEGALRLGSAPAATDLVIRSSGLDPADFGLVLPEPLSGRVSGVLRADGGGDRIAVEGALRHHGERRTTPIRVAGTVTPDSDPRLELRAEADSIGTAALDVLIRDPSGDPAVEGTVALSIEPEVVGLRPGPPIPATLTGSAALAGALDATLRIDRFPLESLPLPGAAAEGTANAVLGITGSFDDPVVGGSIELAGRARFGDDAELERVRGTIELGGGAVHVRGVRARIGGGTLAVHGTVVPGPIGVRIRGGRPGRRSRVDLAVRIDSVLAIDDEFARVRASGRLGIRGPVDSIAVRGRLVPSGFVYEAYLAPEPGIDLDDPPYAELASRAPWPASGRLPAAAGRDDGLLDRLSGEIAVVVTHAIRLLDEDSELRGTGTIRLVFDDGPEPEGIVALEEGFYTQFAQRFLVYGGALDFDGPGLMPRVALRSDYDDEAPIIGDDEVPPWPARFPLYQFFGYGEVGGALEQATQYTIVPRTQLELARRILLGNEPQPVEGWRTTRSWREDGGADVFGERATAQGIPLAWSYTADRLYNYLPLDVAYLKPAVVTVGASYPGRLVVAPAIGAAVVVGDGLELRAAQPLAGVLPRLVAVYRTDRLRFEIFSGPRFHAGLSLGRDRPGYVTRRHTGIGVRWYREY